MNDENRAKFELTQSNASNFEFNHDWNVYVSKGPQDVIGEIVINRNWELWSTGTTGSHSVNTGNAISTILVTDGDDSLKVKVFNSESTIEFEISEVKVNGVEFNGSHSVGELLAELIH